MFTSRPRVTGRITRPLAALALVIGLSVLAAPAKAAFPGGNGKILFNAGGDMYTVNPDGTGVVNISNTSGTHGSRAAWSADGSKFAFTSTGDIYVANADGTNPVKVTSFVPAQDCPRGLSWSPDGQKIVFSNFCAPGGTGYPEIYTINVDGTGLTRLTNDGEADHDPAWSPDGSKIAFTKVGITGPTAIWTINPDGTGKAPLSGTEVQGEVAYPSWSPDGTKLAFMGNRDCVNCAGDDLYTIDVNSHVVTNLTNTPDHESHPVWSPDGQRIAFTACVNRFPNCTDDLFVMSANGTQRTELVNDITWSKILGDWQPINPAPYPQPIGASPIRLSLVPAFTPCDPASANASHEAPLSGASCAPPVPRSSLVAVGPRSLGFARMIVLGSGECAPFDSTHCYPDVTIRFNVTDVRSGSPTGPDYGTPSSQDLTGIATLPGAAQGSTTQITDQNNQSLGDPSGPYDKSATVVPIKFPVPLDCVPVLNPIDGSVCSAQTTANTLVPGSAVAGKRAIWELGQLQVLDQGADGTPGNGDDQVFEAQGVFVP